MSQFSSCTLATLFGAAVGAGVTYLLMKDQADLSISLDDGMQAINEFAEDIEQSATEFLEDIGNAFSAAASDQQTKSADESPTRAADDNKPLA